MTPMLLSMLLCGPVQAASGPPRRPVPESVLAELHTLEARFEAALALVHVLVSVLTPLRGQ